VSDEIMDDVGGEADEVVEDVADEGGGEALEASDAGEHQEPVPDPAKAEKPKPVEPPKPPRTYKVKVNGKDQEIPADKVEEAAAALGVEVEALLGGTRMFRAANERFQKAAEIEKAAKALEAKLKQSPRDALREALGEEGFAKLAIESVQEMMAAEQLTPEQRRIKELEAAQAKVQAEKDAQAQAQKEARAKAFESEVAQKLDTEITAALSAGKLPKDPYVVKRLAALADSYLANGGDPEGFSLADFVPQVQEEMRREHEAFLGSLSGEDVIARFPALAEKVRKAYAERVSGRRSAPPRVEGVTRRPAEAKTFGSIGALLRDF
jgi:hypothetical protein